MDAKQKLNQLRQARGFFPVVVLGGDGKGQMPLVAKGASSSFGGVGFGKGKKGKSGSGRPKGSSKGKGPTGRVRAKQVLNDMCLKCGRWDYTAANCPGKPGGSSPNKKRVIDLDPSDPMINMVLTVENSVAAGSCDGSEFFEVEEAYI